MPTRTLWLVPLFLLCAGAVIGLGPYRQLVESTQPKGTFDESPAASIEDADARVAAMGEIGIALYRKHFWTDLLFVTFNLAALSIAMLVILPHARFSWAFLGLPILAAIADVAENLIVRQFLLKPANESAVALARIITLTKMACFTLAIAVIFAGIARCLWLRRASKPA